MRSERTLRFVFVQLFFVSFSCPDHLHAVDGVDSFISLDSLWLRVPFRLATLLSPLDPDFIAGEDIPRPLVT